MHTTVLSIGEIPAMEVSDEGNASNNAICVDKLSATRGQNGENSHAVSSYLPTLSSNVSSIAGVCTSSEQTSVTTSTSGLAQISKGVVIRPVATASESSSKEYIFLVFAIIFILLRFSLWYINLMASILGHKLVPVCQT